MSESLDRTPKGGRGIGKWRCTGRQRSKRVICGGCISSAH